MASSIVTNSASNITASSATLNATVYLDGEATIFVWFHTDYYGGIWIGDQIYFNGQTGARAVSVNWNGLSPGQTYSFDARVLCDYTNATGATVSFTTLKTAPVVTTSEVTQIGTTSAKLNGLLTYGGSTTTISFEYGLTTSYGSSINGTPYTASGDSSLTATLTGLTPKTTYHYRIKAVSAEGTAYSNNGTFSTNALPKRKIHFPSVILSTSIGQR